MALSNKQRIGLALDEIKPALISYITPVLAEKAGGPRKADIDRAIEESEVRIVKGEPHWDIQALARVLIKLWTPIFYHLFDKSERSSVRGFIQELNTIRNLHAHDMPFSYEDTYRHLDSLSRLAEALDDPDVAQTIRESAKTVIRVQFQEEARSITRTKAAMEGTPLTALKPWREVVAPHRDVARGAFLEAEFVADLHAVHTGKAGSEYGDPEEFFARTFLTDGLRDLLGRALIRLSGKGGSPVMELKTNFGGGKTHSLLALYHLFSGVAPNKLAGMDDILRATGVNTAPPTRRVVIAGHQLGVNQPRRKEDGVIVRTLWGELAWQLGGAAAFEKIRSSDDSGTNPAAEILAELMSDAGPCLILIDEWVAYLRETVDLDGLAGGSFASNFGFAQSLTEAAKVVPHALVVASLPASVIEMGGPKGVAAFNELSNLFQRVATPWQPTRTEEGYEIVRRRLFESRIDYPSRDAAVKSFYEMYAEDRGSYPSNCSEQAYRRKMETCYPIHPELFDKLDGVWSTLPKFQKTRGVLRFVAAVVSELWQRDDRNLMIMPASVPLDSPRVASVVKEVLDGGGSWDGVISADIDGPSAASHLIDHENAALGRYSACRRVARSIFLAAAPTSGPNRGVDDQHLLLACVQPGENAEKFGDGLRRLSERATYLYRDAPRSWFALQPSVQRLAQDRMKGFLDDSGQLDAEIFQRLGAWEKQRSFPGGVKRAKVPADVPDENGTKLILLPPSAVSSRNGKDTAGLLKAEEILTLAANRPRSRRNGLIFLAPDESQLTRLRESMAWHLAWKSIHDGADALELTKHDTSQASQKLKETRENMDLRLGETWCHILVPTVKDPASSEISWETIHVAANGDKAAAVLKKLSEREIVHERFSAFHLNRELTRHFWVQSPHVTTRTVSDAFGTYLYFPKLLQPDLLLSAIENQPPGDPSRPAYFGYADAYDEETSRYQGLRSADATYSALLGDGVLIKPDVAGALLAARNEDTRGTGPAVPPVGPTPVQPSPHGGGGGKPLPPAKPVPVRFYGSVELPTQKVTSSVQRIVDEVVQHLSSQFGSKVIVTLNIDATRAEGFDEALVRVVSENAQTLGFDRGNTGFE